MIWSLVKIIAFIGLIALATLGAGQLAETHGGLRLAIANTEFNLGPLQAAIALAGLVVAVWLFLKLLSLCVAILKFLSGDETAISRYFDQNRERKGFDALSEALMALASGENRLAISRAQKAEKMLERPDLTNLVLAQAAEASGDTGKAQEIYKRLLANDKTRFVGVHGIMKQRLSEGDNDTALKLAQKAFALKPKHQETQDILLKLQAETSDWHGARVTLGAKLRQGILPRDVHKRRDAILALSEAKDILAEGNSIEAREAAIEANRKSPDLIPAAVMAARTYIEQGNPKAATRVLKKAWEASPHPDLAAAFAEIAPEETPKERLKRFGALLKIQPNASETVMLAAELHIANEDFPGARRALGNLVETEPTARNLTIMAAIERGFGAEDTVVRSWLTKALTASRGPQWCCDKCQSISTQWGPVCGNCGGFDTLSWRVPNTADVAMPASTELLPLMVKSPEAAPVAVIADGDAVDILDGDLAASGDAPMDTTKA